ncbi:MAG: 16S rRNA (uracil(1498)-N(3))-methyltransferase [Magnetococcales bacterium]|nr:16S rRNA (uracil(1498)-N(3))-methyltransferase [Magnetococcales bacterium]
MVPRLFVAGGLHPTEESHRPEARIGHYLLRVLRLASGDEVRLFDGSGGEWEGTLHVKGSSVEVHLIRHWPEERESPLAVTLVHGLSRSASMDLVVQKGVELGVTAIMPLLTQRSVSRPDARQAIHKTERWQRIAIEATEQCGRTRVPHIHPPASWEEIAATIPDGNRLLFWEEQRNGKRLGSLTPPPLGSALTLLTGPEGGLSTEEVRFAQERLGFVTVGLGPRILRTETAALAVLTMVQTLWGDMG